MRNQQIIGTLKAKGANGVEYVAKCERCGGTLLLERREVNSKTLHDLCREDEAYAAGRLAGYEEGLEAR